jgi:hypothetical protein
MKVQTGTMLIQDMGLRKGELVQIGDGPKAFIMKYMGTTKRNGKIYDRLDPIKTEEPTPILLVKGRPEFGTMRSIKVN